jgi:hypothetical protein
MRSYYDHLTRAQKSHFYWIYWKVVIAQFATVASELFFFLSWSLLILHFDSKILEIIIKLKKNLQ